jgi:hypothetical protein
MHVPILGWYFITNGCDTKRRKVILMYYFILTLQINLQQFHIPHVVLIGQSAKELGNNIHTAKVTYANSMEH